MGVAGDVLWGLCAGSGKNPYQTIVDLSGPAYKCSCPSRKFPCKHALGLLLNWANGSVPEESAPADFARAWLDDRRARAEKAEKAFARTVPADSPLALTRAPSRTKPPPRAGLSSGRSGSRAAWPSFSRGSGTRSWSACRPRAGYAGTRTRSRRGWSMRKRPASPPPARAVRGSGVRRGMARPAAGRVRATAPAGPGAPAARRPAARLGRHGPVPGRVPDQPQGRARQARGHRPLGGARRPRLAGREASRDAASGCADATAAGGRCC